MNYIQGMHFFKKISAFIYSLMVRIFIKIVFNQRI